MEEKVDYSSAWSSIKRIFPILEENILVHHLDKQFAKEEFYEAVQLTVHANISVHIQSLIMLKTEQRLREVIVPEFWKYFKKSENDNKGRSRFSN